MSKEPPRPERRLTSGKQRTASSRRWLERQLRDPYVLEARRHGFRSRAAFKLIELDDRFHFLKRGSRVIDLGAAPGGWTQVAVQRIGSNGRIIAVDRQEMAPIAGAEIMTLDFLDDDAPQRLIHVLGGGADVVLSDMAPAASGHASADHLRIVALAELAFEFAIDVLKPDGAFVCKVWQGGSESTLLKNMKRYFALVRHAKPPASRSESAELFVVATGFRPSAP